MVKLPALILKEKLKKYDFYLLRAKKENPPSEYKIKYWTARVRKAQFKLREMSHTKILTFQSTFNGAYSISRKMR